MEQILNRKDIILVPFPFSDQTGSKRRPAVIISNDKFNQNSQDIIVCGVTSNIDNEYYTTYIKPEDWKNGLYSESCVKVTNVLIVDKKIILKRIGRLSSERFSEVMQKFYEIFK